MHLKCSAKRCITNMLRGPLLGIYMLSWNIRVLKAYILILLPSSWNLILVPVESLDLDDVCARYWPQSFFFFFVRLISHLPPPIIATFPLSESSSAHPSLWVWAKCLKAMGSVHWGLWPLGFRSGALLLSFHFCFWTCNSPIICKGLKARESFFSLQRCRVITLRRMCWYQLAMVETFNKYDFMVFHLQRNAASSTDRRCVCVHYWRHIHLSRKGLTQTVEIAAKAKVGGLGMSRTKTF